MSCCKEDYRTYICAYLQTFYMECLQYDTHSEKKKYTKSSRDFMHAEHLHKMHVIRIAH